jgi:hypothetical protein
MPSSLQRQSKRKSRRAERYGHSSDPWTKRRKLEFSNQRRPNSCVTSGMCSRMNCRRLGPEAVALPSAAVRLAASASIRSINSFGTNLTMCCPLFFGRLLRSPARNNIISSRVSSVLVLYIGSSCPAALRRRFAWPELSRHRRY